MNQTNRFPDRRACMFVDYENLFEYVERNVSSRTHTNQMITSLLKSTLYHLTQDLSFSLHSSVAYADFASIGGGGPRIQHDLYMAGLEPQFVPASLQANASEIQICIDVLDALLRPIDIQAIFLVTGNRLYLPLIKFCQQRNVSGHVITFEPPNHSYAGENSELFISAETLLDSSSPPQFENRPQTYSEPSYPEAEHSSSLPENISEISDKVILDALDIVCTFFGQYEEIYLTPLLRKFSEDPKVGHEAPKFLVNKLEESGAVWLEKRKGYPYNYTVMLINYNHPNVQDLQESENGMEYPIEDLDEEQTTDQSYTEEHNPGFV